MSEWNPADGQQTSLPLYHKAIDWNWLYSEFPVPDVYARTVYRWPAERVRELQNRRFLALMEVGWKNGFYQRLWKKAGLAPGDIGSLDDIIALPTFNSDDIKNDQAEHPPFGLLPGYASLAEHLQSVPSRLQSSGGTTGKARYTLQGIVENEVNSISAARGLYLQGVRPGDILQIPATNSMASLPWAYSKACNEYLGVLPVTTGSGVVTPTRRQLEIAFDIGVNCWMSFPEYLTRLAQGARDEFGRDVRELKTKMITTFLGPDTEGTLRAHLESLWGCPVYDNYGVNEVGHGALECSHRKGLHFMEDLSYNQGPMLSKELFDEFLVPYYKEIIPELNERGIIPLLDSDGQIESIIPWYEAIGIRGCGPLERMAGVDVNRIRQNHPEWIMIGGFDKTVMPNGEAAMRAEFERILPAMKSLRYVPTVDHQTPPGVSLENYLIYRRLQNEYAAKAVRVPDWSIV